MNDDELLAHLKATDPALTSKAPRPDVPRLVEATMSTSTRTKATETKSPVRGAPRRRLVPAMAFTALLLVVGGGVTWGVARGGEGTADKAGAVAAAEGEGEGGRVPQLEPQTLILPDGDSAAVKCAAPTPDSLRRHDLAFEGTVTAEQDDRVVLRVDHWYRLDPNLANPSHEVRLSSDSGNSEAPDFPLGAHYLVTADTINGIIPVCGGTTEATDEARAMFREAFEK